VNWREYARTPRVAEQSARAQRAGQKLSKKAGKEGRTLSPVRLAGRAITSSFWGKAWCANLEAYRDYEYRLPRGRSYLRSGAVLDLKIEPGRIAAVVAGSRPHPYEVEVTIQALETTRWSELKRQCAGESGLLIELLEGRLSERVMRQVTDRTQGLFPKPGDIQMSCSCPDWATMCKHVAAVLYGVGARLDTEPQLLFTLRNLDHGELIAAAVDGEGARGKTQRKTIAEADLAGVFGIELADAPRPARKSRPAATRKSPAKRRTVAKATARPRGASASTGKSGARGSTKP
jgi:uncharacterized Zn finger protein